jgi:ribose/xylose/arabinose/galactoside ABC-type transport system permease subunit
VILQLAEGAEIRSTVSSFSDFGSGGVHLPFLHNSRGVPVLVGYPTLWFLGAVVIGGTAMTGGRGSVLGTLVGVLLLGVINNMLTMLSVDNYIQGLVKGSIIIGAVLIQRSSRR